MKIFISLLKADLYRALISLNLVISAVFIIFVMYISCSGFIKETSDVLYLFGNALTGSGSILFILCIAPILPYGMSFVEDVEDKALTFWVIRSGIEKYSISKFLSSVIAGFLSVATGMIVFTLIMSIFFPLFNGNLHTGDSYRILLENNQPWIYVLVCTVHYSLSGALFAGAAVTLSAFIPNKFSTMAAPIVIYFVLMRLTAYAPIPDFLKPHSLVEGIQDAVSPATTFLYKLIPIVGILGIFMYITVKQTKKRIGRS